MQPDSMMPGAGSRFALFLLLLMFGLELSSWAADTNDAGTARAEYAAPPPGSIPWQNHQDIINKQREQYRWRMVVPGAVAADAPRSREALATGGPPPPAARPVPVPATAATVQRLLFFGVLLLAGVIVLLKIAPECEQAFYRWFAPGFAKRSAGVAAGDRVRAEDESFENYLASLREAAGAVAMGQPGAKDSHRTFFDEALKQLAGHQLLLRGLQNQPEVAARKKTLTELGAGMNRLKEMAFSPETLPVWQMAFALGGLSQQLAAKAGNFTPSTLRTLVVGVDLLVQLCTARLKMNDLLSTPLKFLIVDDDWLSRQALFKSLQKAFSPPDICEEAGAALMKLEQQAYDVIFLDVQMPGMDGLELCSKIRSAGLNRATPVVFVSSQSDFDARAKAVLSGGNELLGKPFLTFEITVKALTLALQSRVGGREVVPLFQINADQTPAEPALSPSITPAPAVVTSPTATFLPSPAARASGEAIKNFLARLSSHVEPLHEQGQKMLHATGQTERQVMLGNLFRRINPLVTTGLPASRHPLCQLISAVDGLVTKLVADPQWSTPAMLATLADALALFRELCSRRLHEDFTADRPVHILVVDDDLVARRALTGALQTAFEKPAGVEDGESALVLADRTRFDVIFMDVVMPGRNGFEVCSQIRRSAANVITPVVFVTALNDAGTLDLIRRHGGEFIGKPFQTSLVIVKALTLVLRGRLRQHHTPSLV